MDLLIIKCGDDYIRIKEDAFFTVGLDKASVFPMHQLDQVRDRLKQVQSGGFVQAAIYRLTLTERPFEEAGACN
ncbi:hypothetical protein Dvar_71070 [Desulfosarcina variabilis str. Montpellier]|uniref:hypothetical protein n=1 Tax=Desulfosarcina variabilis TaxID=2300 RepID=UPI003AFA1BBB